MELEHVGAHCQHEGCNQKDFLPFKCGSCGKSLCLIHRSYVAHDCSGGDSKDMTSLDCPICGRAVKFDKAQDPNLVWNEHYSHHCTQQPGPHDKKVVRCFRPQCNTVLGPSNTFTCGKCHQRVCLAHRLPEEHSCVGHVRESFLRKVQGQMTVGNAEKAKKPVKKESHHVSMFLPTGESHHHKDKKKEGHGHAEHTPPPPPTAAHSLECPFCGLAHQDNAGLAGHIAAFHPDGTPATSVLPPPPPASATASYREVCPVCQARFPDAISLVHHFESAHSENAQRPPTAPNEHADQTKHSNCALS
jgi:predicted nucleic acid binding AN1-type Zn finger protein